MLAANVGASESSAPTSNPSTIYSAAMQKTNTGDGATAITIAIQ